MNNQETMMNCVSSFNGIMNQCIESNDQGNEP